VIEWLLVEYGEVLSTPPPDDTITELAALAGQNPAEFLQRYWQARPGYDPCRADGDAPLGRPRRPVRHGQRPPPGRRPMAVSRLRSADLPLATVST
jgi:hypothetical protein